jgi:hypothetical protein
METYSYSVSVWCGPCCVETLAKWLLENPEGIDATRAIHGGTERVYFAVRAESRDAAIFAALEKVRAFSPTFRATDIGALYAR